MQRSAIPSLSEDVIFFIGSLRDCISPDFINLGLIGQKSDDQRVDQFVNWILLSICLIIGVERVYEN